MSMSEGNTSNNHEGKQKRVTASSSGSGSGNGSGNSCQSSTCSSGGGSGFGGAGGGGGGGGGSSSGMTASTTTQTRFSFYNAEDFKGVSVGVDVTAVSASASASQSSFVFPTTSAAAVAAVSSAAVDVSNAANAAAAKASSTTAAAEKGKQQVQTVKDKTLNDPLNDANAELDSAKILKSLQAHEQQRLQLLGATTTTTTTSTTKPRRSSRNKSTNNIENDFPQQQPQPFQASSSSYNATGNTSANTNCNSNNKSNTNNSINPYEDAIREALELLRKHRTTLSPGSTNRNQGTGTNTDTAQHLLPQPKTSQPQPLPIPQRRKQEQQQQPMPEVGWMQTPREADIVLQNRGDYHTISSSANSKQNHHQQQQQLHFPGTPDSNVSPCSSSFAANNIHAINNNVSPSSAASSSHLVLGEAYQTEIEARRKLRQERMAKYASRLAELKSQEANASTSLSPSMVLEQQQLGKGAGGLLTTTSATTSTLPSSSTIRRTIMMQQQQEKQPYTTMNGRGADRAIAGASGGSSYNNKFWDEYEDAAVSRDGEEEEERRMTEAIRNYNHVQASTANINNASHNVVSVVVPPPGVEHTLSAGNGTSLSSITGVTPPKSREDEILLHRGVEKVLLAILERANSTSQQQSRNNSATNSLDATDNINILNGSTSQQQQQEQQQPPSSSSALSWQITTMGGVQEEKKSSSDPYVPVPVPIPAVTSHDENSLFQAMSDLLGTASHTSSHLIPQSSSTPQQQLHQQLQPYSFEDHDDDGFDPIAASRSSDNDGSESAPFLFQYTRSSSNNNDRKEDSIKDASRQHSDGGVVTAAAATVPTHDTASLKLSSTSSSNPPSSYLTELANTSDGIEAVASDPDMSELDELVRKLSDPLHQQQKQEQQPKPKQQSPAVENKSTNSNNNPPNKRRPVGLEPLVIQTSHSDSQQDESIDQRVRRLLGVTPSGNTPVLHRSNNNEASSSLDHGHPSQENIHQTDSEEAESIENTSIDRTSTSNGESAVTSLDDSILGDDDEEDYDEDDDDDEELDRHNDTIDMVLGPLSKKVGGTTGVVLEPDSPPQPSRETPSILESLSAAVSLVVSGNTASGSKLFQSAYSSSDEDDDDDSGSDSDSVADENAEANSLMRSLCSHLLPVGVNSNAKLHKRLLASASKHHHKLLDKRPEWDEGNPEEPGYRIVRLTKLQLRRVEAEFEKMVDNLKHSSEQNLRHESGSDETFERDLKAAEELLDREEERLKKVAEISSSSVVKVESLTSLKSQQQEQQQPLVLSSPDRHSVVSADGEDPSAGLAHFPGVKRAGKGEMGDLEFFCLPVIFKSHVTGFEPTKDMCLEPGNVVAGQYLVEGELGSAAFSTAYRCIDLNSHTGDKDGHEEVCLKVIKNTKDFFDQSLDEIKILELLRQTGKCREKCIVEMKTFFYHREHLVIVTELLRQNLFEFGKFIVDHDEEPYFTLPRLGFITRQVLIALDFVHSLGLVHSDVKPENILLSSYSRAKVKLIDFGSSCYLTDRQSSYIQSRSYRAPEVVLGLPYDGRIDIWSLGCVVAEMFTGEVTFQNDSIVSMLSRIEAICGPFPRHMIAQGRQSGRFFTKCGLLYERVLRSEDPGEEEDVDSVTSDEDQLQQQHFDLFQPKITTLAARLGFEADLLESYHSSGGKKLSKEQRRRAMFVDFVSKLLTIDPETRPTAAAALEHPWMQYAASLTEEDIKYP